MRLRKTQNQKPFLQSVPPSLACAAVAGYGVAKVRTLSRRREREHYGLAEKRNWTVHASIPRLAGHERVMRGALFLNLSFDPDLPEVFLNLSLSLNLLNLLLC